MQHFSDAAVGGDSAVGVLLVLGSRAEAADDAGELTKPVVVRPSRRNPGLLCRRPRPPTAPSWDVGPLRRDRRCSRQVCRPHRLHCRAGRETGLAGGTVCAQVESFPGGTSATGTLKFAPGSTLELTVNGHHPRWLGAIAVIAAFALGVGVAVLVAVSLRWKASRALHAAAHDATDAGVSGVRIRRECEFLAGHGRADQDVARCLQDRCSQGDDGARRFRNRLSSLDHYNDIVMLNHPDLERGEGRGCTRRSRHVATV